MGTDEDSTSRPLLQRRGFSYDIRTLEDGTVIAFEVGFLEFHLITILLELLLDPCATLFMRLTVHGARTKGTLGGTELIGRIRIKLDSDNGLVLYGLFLGGATSHQTYDTDDINIFPHDNDPFLFGRNSETSLPKCCNSRTTELLTLAY